MSGQVILLDENAIPCHDCGELMNETGVDLDGIRWWFCPKDGYDFHLHWSAEEQAEWEATKFQGEISG